MSRRRLAIFRCDASLQTGGGHVVRCMALADAMLQDGWEVSFAVSPATIETVPQLAARSWRVVPHFESEAAEPKLLQDTWPDGADLIVIDHYGRGLEFEAALTPWAKQRLVISDFADRNHQCEFICDQTIGRDASEYHKLIPETCTALAGTNYALLRPAFALHRHRLDPDRPVTLQRILVSFGLGVQQAVTSLVLSGLEQVGFAGVVDVVIGKTAAETLRETFRPASQRIHFHSRLEADAMANLLAQADLTIGAGGTSVYERCCLGAPQLMVALADNQNDNINAIIRVGAGADLGPTSELTPERVAVAVKRLANDIPSLGRMRQAALVQADGRGAERVALALRPERSRTSKRIDLRPVTAADAEVLYQFQQQPETRRYARVALVPAWDEHVAWLARKLANPTCLFNLVIMAGTPVGAIRLDASPPIAGAPEAFEISIFVSSEHHNAGIGMASLSLARRLVPRAEIKAVVLDTNEVSLRLFHRAGYHFEKKQENQVHFRRLPTHAV